MRKMLKGIQIENFIPRMGCKDDFFERLAEYIAKFDPKWITRIRPASIKDIDNLLTISGLKEKGIEIPAYYRIFLEKMGVNSGGLFSSEGTSDIQYIYDEDYEQDEYEGKLVYFWWHAGAIGETLEIGNGENPLVGFNTNFEQRLFQHALENYICKYVNISFTSSHNDRKEALIKSNRLPKDGDYPYGSPALMQAVIETVDDIMEQNQLKRMWISDNNMSYRAGFNEKIVFYINAEGYGRIARVDIDSVTDLAKQFADRLGMTLDTRAIHQFLKDDR